MPLRGKFVLVLASLFVAAAAPAPDSAPSSNDPLNRQTPQSSVYGFLEACHSKNYDKAWRYLDLRKLQPQQRLKEGPQLAQDLAKLLDSDVQFDVAALSRDPEGERDDGLPADRERIATFTASGKTLDLQLQRDTLRPGFSVWLFSQDSVELIPTLTQSIRESPIERILPYPLVAWTLLDTSLWRWIALLLLAFALAAFSRLLSRAVLSLIAPALKRLSPAVASAGFETLLGPVQLLVSAALFRAAMEAVDPSAILRLYLGRLLTVVSCLGTAWLCARALDIGSERLHRVLQANHQTFAFSVLPLAARIVKVAAFVFAIIAVLSGWGYNTGTILAGLGIGGVAIALAAQKTIENLFGGVAVISDRPVYVGDFCKFGDSVGTVEDIGLRSTRIRTNDRTEVIVPNAQFSTMTLENFSRRDKMLFHPMLNLRRDTSPEQVRTILEAIQKILKDHPTVEAGDLAVRFVGVGSYSLDVEVFAYVLTLDGSEFLRIQQDLLLNILDAVAAAGTALALPTQASIVYGSQGGSPTASEQVNQLDHQNGNNH
jgi:MscS family membrane protein